MKKQPKYLIYATLLDSFQSYLDSNTLWEMYWGGSENPKFSIEEFEAEKRQDVLDRINRVPFSSEAADRGTAFNEVVDCIILGRNTDREDMKIETLKEKGVISVEFHESTFEYPISLCREMASYFKGATPQVLTEGILPTKHGDVLLYGYIDELMPFSVHDIKTTTQYNAFKFRKNWQHLVYPYCLHQEGNEVNIFEYNVVKWGKVNEIHNEVYNFDLLRDTTRLVNHCEALITFIENNRDLITDKKIFNLHENEQEHKD